MDQKLLWTGGWDSTFRLLQLLLEHRVPVRPCYFLDPDRRSLGRELGAQKFFRGVLAAEYPFTRKLLRPTVFVDVSGVRRVPAVAQALKEVRSRIFLGSQYDWLFSHCHGAGITGMEIGVEGGCHIEGPLRQVTERVRKGRFETYRVARTARGPLAKVFRPFELPILDLSRKDMMDRSRRAGWDKYMYRTWFCHTPDRKGGACGACYACRNTILEGMGFRIGSWNRLVGPLRAVVRPGVKWLRAALGDVERRPDLEAL